MSWLQSICPRCRGLMYVPGTLVGHSIVCDKCALPYVLYPQQPAQQAPQGPQGPMQYPPQQQMPQQQMPYQAPMQPPMNQGPMGQAPMGLPPSYIAPLPPPPPRPSGYAQPGGYGTPGGYAQPSGPAPPSHAPSSHSPASHAPPGGYVPPAPSARRPAHQDEYEMTAPSLPHVPLESRPPLPYLGGEPEAGAAPPPKTKSNPFGSPLPEIEILPPPKARNPSMRKRSSSSKRSRKRDAAGNPMPHAPPPLPEGATPPTPPAAPPRRRSRRNRTAPFPAHYVSQADDRAAHDELVSVEERIRRASIRRKLVLALVSFCMLSMALVATLLLRWSRSAGEVPVEAAPVPIAAPPTDEPIVPAPPAPNDGATGEPAAVEA